MGHTFLEIQSYTVSISLRTASLVLVCHAQVYCKLRDNTTNSPLTMHFVTMPQSCLNDMWVYSKVIKVL